MCVLRVRVDLRSLKRKLNGKGETKIAGMKPSTKKQDNRRDGQTDTLGDMGRCDPQWLPCC